MAPRRSTSDSEPITTTGATVDEPEQPGVNLSDALASSDTLRTGNGADGGADYRDGTGAGADSGAGGAHRRRHRRTRSEINAQEAAAQTLLTEGLQQQADEAAEFFIGGMNSLAVMLTHTDAAAMNITEQMLIQPPLATILARPGVVQKASAYAPYMALIMGFTMWTSRIATLRRMGQPQSVAPQAEPDASHENGTTPVEDMPDTSPILSQLQTLQMS